MYGIVHEAGVRAAGRRQRTSERSARSRWSTALSSSPRVYMNTLAETLRAALSKGGAGDHIARRRCGGPSRLLCPRGTTSHTTPRCAVEAQGKSVTHRVGPSS